MRTLCRMMRTLKYKAVSPETSPVGPQEEKETELTSHGKGQFSINHFNKL